MCVYAYDRDNDDAKGMMRGSILMISKLIKQGILSNSFTVGVSCPVTGDGWWGKESFFSLVLTLLSKFSCSPKVLVYLLIPFDSLCVCHFHAILRVKDYKVSLPVTFLRVLPKSWLRILFFNSPPLAVCFLSTREVQNSKKHLQWRTGWQKSWVRREEELRRNISLTERERQNESDDGMKEDLTWHDRLHPSFHIVRKVKTHIDRDREKREREGMRTER